jgi:hypothetical protein
MVRCALEDHHARGARRALVVAGAETVVMSLWKVKDDSTRLHMESYYRKLLAGQAPRRSQRARRAEDGWGRSKTAPRPGAPPPPPSTR